MWRDIKKIFCQKNNFVLATHINPDGDGIGAACALTELLLKKKKKVRFVSDSPIPKKFSFLNFRGVHETATPETDFSKTDALVVLDTHKKERIGSIAALIDRPGIVSVCIDHHQAESVFTPHTFIDPNACSVGAMIYTLFKEMGFELNLEAATGIYTSILCDTGRFSYASTSRKAHKIADECMKLGVDPDLMYSRVFQHVSLAEMKMFANVLQHMETYLDNRVIIQEIRKEDYLFIEGETLDVEHLDLDTFLELNKQVENIICVVLLRELPNQQVRVSLRSNADLNIVHIMEALGGGGHRKAAGMTWKGSIEEVKKKILDKLEKLITSTSIK